MASIYESSTENNSDDGSISMNALEEIRYGRYVKPNINSRDTRLKIRDRIKQAQSEWKEAEIPAKRMVKDLHQVFKAFVN